MLSRPKFIAKPDLQVYHDDHKPRQPQQWKRERKTPNVQLSSYNIVGQVSPSWSLRLGLVRPDRDRLSLETTIPLGKYCSRDVCSSHMCPVRQSLHGKCWTLTPQLTQNPSCDCHQIWHTWLRHGYLPPRKIWAQFVKGFLLPICAKYTPHVRYATHVYYFLLVLPIAFSRGIGLDTFAIAVWMS